MKRVADILEWAEELIKDMKMEEPYHSRSSYLNKRAR